MLSVENLEVSFKTYRGIVNAVRDISFSIGAKETLAIVGESGSGKSVIANSIMKLLTFKAVEIGKNSKISFFSENLLNKSEKDMQKVRGEKIGMIFQDPMTSLNPTMKIGEQVAEAYKVHKEVSWKKAYSKALELLKLVNIEDPEKRMNQYPHELSGGMRQRIMIASAIICNPKLLIADEPTTALDVTNQAQVLNLLQNLKNKFEMAMIIITHDLNLVSSISDRVLVVYGGKVMEEGATKDIFLNPEHPYTKALINSIPKFENKSRLFSIEGTPPNLLKNIEGCPFYDRCPESDTKCKLPLKKFNLKNGSISYCWRNENL